MTSGVYASSRSDATRLEVLSRARAALARRTESRLAGYCAIGGDGMTAKAAARRLGVSLTTVYDWRRRLRSAA